MLNNNLLVAILFLTGERELLFREDSFTTRMLDEFLRIMGIFFLNSSLYNLVNEVCTNPGRYEVRNQLINSHTAYINKYEEMKTC